MGKGRREREDKLLVTGMAEEERDRESEEAERERERRWARLTF